MKKIPLYLSLFLLFTVSAKIQAQTHTDINAGSSANSKPENGSGTLGKSFDTLNFCGLNYLEASVLIETRNASQAGGGLPASLNLASLLPCTALDPNYFQVIKAYLYFDASYYTKTFANPATVVITNPAGIITTYTNTPSIGNAGPACESETGTVAYRADVTSSIDGKGIYTINITGTGLNDSTVNGCTLIIIYSDKTATYSGSIVLWDGIVTDITSTPLSQTLSGFNNLCATTTSANAFGIFSGMAKNSNGNSNTETFNGNTAAFPNNFWNFDSIPTSVTSGQTSAPFNTYTNNTGSPPNCYSWVAAGLYWQNTTCKSCTPKANGISLVTTATEPLCNGNCNGMASVTASGGSSPFTYSWSTTPSQSTPATTSTLCAGTYTVTVSNSCGKSATASVILNQPDSLKGKTSSTSNICGDTNGTATDLVTGGTGPYTYIWNPPTHPDSSTVTGLLPGTYTVTVYDNNFCNINNTVSVGSASPITTSECNVDNVKCHGSCTGSASVCASGGKKPYAYSWSSGKGTDDTATGLCAGTYTVQVTDKNGCVTPATILITQPTALKDSIKKLIVPKCSSVTGSVVVGVKGGVSPYTYLWAPPLINTTDSASGLSAGTYTLYITDNHGCMDTAKVTITQPPPMKVIINTTPATCNYSDGSASASVTNGTKPYTYSWSNAKTTDTIKKLSLGTYTVTVTDSNGCKVDTTGVVKPPPTLKDTVKSPTDVKCYGGSDGSATATGIGGEPPYSFKWYPGGQVTATLSGLTAGVYTVSVRDTTTCDSNHYVVTITQPLAPLTTTTSSTGVKCNGGSTGSATVAPSGGTSPYTYSWNNGETNAQDTGLAYTAKCYTVTITDNHGCTISPNTTVCVTQPAAIRDSAAIIYPKCNGGTGSATVGVKGGTKPYTYSWSNNNSNTTNGAIGLSAGIYTVTIKDNNGCFQNLAINITQPAILSVLATALANVQCRGGSNGNAAATISGGTSPYKYSWSNGITTTSTGPILTAGAYVVTVQDSCGAKATATVNITQPNVLSVSPSVIFNASCTGGSNGDAKVIVSGGTPRYNYQWINSSGTAVNFLDSTGRTLYAGTYTVLVIDNCGDSASSTITIGQPDTLKVVASATANASCYGGTNGSATAVATGGTPSYHYSWVNSSLTVSTSNPTGAILSAGTYTVTVIDSCGNKATDSVIIGQPKEITGTFTNSGIRCYGSTDTTIVNPANGTAPFKYSWSTTPKKTTQKVTGLSAGTYTVMITDANGCSAPSTLTLTQPVPISETNSVTSAKCNSTNNASVTQTVSGGVSPYVYSWSNGNTNQNPTNILPGIYTVAITDANGCRLLTTVKIGYNDSVFANVAKIDSVCHNQTVLLNGDSSKYGTSYKWLQIVGNKMDSIGHYDTLHVLPKNDTTIYLLVVKNAVCSDTIRDTIVLEPKVTANAGPDQTIALVPGKVFIGGNPTGTGQGTLFYYWNPTGSLNYDSVPNPTASPTVTTVYTVYVINKDGCTSWDTVTVFVLPGINVPNVLTPNGDGINDVWVLPFAYDFPNMDVYIYNRWGQLLYHSSGSYTAWDCTYNGKVVSDGTYFYIIDLNDTKFPTALRGHIQVITGK